jgi:hypothetical protein
MKAAEIRASLLAKDKAGKHTKHVALEITDPDLCAAFTEMLEGRTPCPCTQIKTACTCTKGQEDGETVSKPANPDCPFCAGSGTVLKPANPNCKECSGSGTVGHGIDLDNVPDGHKEVLDGKKK